MKNKTSSLLQASSVCSLTSLLVFASSVPAIQAAPVLVPNFSFELPDLDDGQFSNGLNNWTLTTDGLENTDIGVENAQNNLFPNATGPDPVGTLPTPADGLQYAFVNRGATMTSDLLTTVDLTQVYTLTVAIGNRLDGFTAAQTPRFSIAVGSTAASAMDVAFTTISSLPTAGTFANFSVSYTPTVGDIGQNLFIRLSAPITDINRQAIFDNIRLDAVPEPGSIALLLGGAGVLGLLHRRRSAGL